MFEPKYVVRKGTLFNRRMLPDTVWKQRNDQVCKYADQLLIEKAVRCFHVFLPIKRNKEADLWSVLYEAIDRGQQVFISATNFEQETMNHFSYSKDLVFEEDRYGIPTPRGGKSADLSLLDLIFIPMLAGDKYGNRIGYGKGYYDRLLAAMPSSLLKIGVSLNPLFDRFTFAEEHDIALDYVITPHEIIKCLE